MGAPKGNKNAKGCETSGKPPFYKSAKELEDAIKKYFQEDHKTRKVVVGKAPNNEVIELPVITITGLAHYLGFASRQSFYDYEEKVEFSYIIKRARLEIEINYEEQLQYGNVTGAIFALKNMGWDDRTVVDQNVKNETPQLNINIDGKELNVKV